MTAEWLPSQKSNGYEGGICSVVKKDRLYRNSPDGRRRKQLPPVPQQAWPHADLPKKDRRKTYFSWFSPTGLWVLSFKWKKLASVNQHPWISVLHSLHSGGHTPLLMLLLCHLPAVPLKPLCIADQPCRSGRHLECIAGPCGARAKMAVHSDACFLLCWPICLLWNSARSWLWANIFKASVHTSRHGADVLQLWAFSENMMQNYFSPHSTVVCEHPIQKQQSLQGLWTSGLWSCSTAEPFSSTDKLCNSNRIHQKRDGEGPSRPASLSENKVIRLQVPYGTL